MAALVAAVIEEETELARVSSEDDPPVPTSGQPLAVKTTALEETGDVLLDTDYNIQKCILQSDQLEHPEDALVLLDPVALLPAGTPMIELHEPAEVATTDYPMEIEVDDANNSDPPASDGGALTKKGLLRKRKTFNMPLNIRKNMKASSKIQKLQLKPPCDGCNKKCTEKVSEELRSKINSQYSNWTRVQQQMFIFNSCCKEAVKRRTTTNNNLKMNTFHYFLNGVDGDKIEVCKIFFLTTLGYHQRNDQFLRNTLIQSDPTAFIPEKDKRGQHRNKESINREILREHIMSYKPSVSHYRRVHAPNRLYLPSDLTITSMHSDFAEKNPLTPCSYDVYRSFVKDMNISFAKLGHEECEQCEHFKQHDKDHTAENLNPDCDACKNWSLHIQRAKASRDKYRLDKIESERLIEGVIYFSADLQKVIMLPRMDTFKSVVFTKRIIAFNESFVPLGELKTQKPHAAIWHEGTAGRKKEDIVSTFHAFIMLHRDADELVLWLDNCAGQNKNWTLFTYFVHIINSPLVSLKNLTVKYFEPGHTFMSADSFHHQVEISMKRQGRQCDFNDFKIAVQNANKSRVCVIEMTPDKFFDWKDETSQYKLKRTNPRPYLSDMVQVVAQRGLRTLSYRTDFETPLKKLDFLVTRMMKGDAPLELPLPRTDGGRGIPLDKKNDIIHTLCPLMPENRRTFWQELKVSDVADLVLVNDDGC
jgi:hypothetical protein